MTITRIFRLGTPYHWRAMKPARSGKSDASKLGTVHAGAACSEDGCQITAAAPPAAAAPPVVARPAPAARPRGGPPAVPPRPRPRLWAAARAVGCVWGL